MGWKWWLMDVYLVSSIVNGHVKNRLSGGTYHMQGLCKVYVREYHPKVWQEIYYWHTSILGTWDSQWENRWTVSTKGRVTTKGRYYKWWLMVESLWNDAQWWSLQMEVKQSGWETGGKMQGNDGYPLVICYIAIEHGPLNSEFFRINRMVFSTVMWTFTRG